MLIIFPPPLLSTSLHFACEGLSQLHQAHSLHFITGQSYKMAFYPPSSIQLNIWSMKSNISLHYKLIVETRWVSVNHCFAGTNCLTTAVRALDGTRIITFNSRNPSSFCQPLFRRQRLSYNSCQNTRRDKNLLFQKNSWDHSLRQCKIVYVNKYINDHVSLSVLRSQSAVIIGICCTLT
jgi:hypothetical protein